MTQTVILTQPVRVAGSVLDAGTTQTLADDIAADLVARGFASAVGIPVWQSPAAQVARSISHSNIPFLIPPGDGGANGLSFSGTNGAFTLSAAILASTGATLAGCYAYFSANFGGSTRPAGWYWTVFSSDTAGTVYADMYTSGIPRRIASPTPISENLTGRITSTTNEVTAISGIILPAGSLGKNGSLEMKAHLSGSTGGTKTFRVRDSEASIQLFNYSATTSPVSEIFGELVCFDSDTIKAYHRVWGSVSASSYGAALSNIDTSISRVLSVSLQASTTTAAPILMSLRLLATFGS